MFYKLTYYKKRAPKDVTKGKLESLLESFVAIFVFLTYIILRKTEDFGNFTTSHRIDSSLLQKKKEFSRRSRVNKLLGYFELRASALSIKTKPKTKMEKTQT